MLESVNSTTIDLESSSPQLDNLDEATVQELKQRAWKTVAKRVRSQNLRSTLLGITKEGIIKYKTTSGTTPGKFWYQEIYLEDLGDVVDILLNDPAFTARDALLLALKGHIKVHCDDLSFKYYGWQYIGTIDRYALYPNKRFPKKRNPSLTGSCCKHLLSVLSQLPRDWPKIVQQLRKKNIIPKPSKRRSKAVQRVKARMEVGK